MNLKNRLQENIDKLLSTGPRPPGSNAELAAAKWIEQKLTSFGYYPEIQYFASGSHNAVCSRLTVDGVEYNSLPSLFSASGKVSGELIFISDIFAFPEKNADGKIAVMYAHGGLKERFERMSELKNCGLKAIICISPEMDIISTKLIRYENLGLPVAAVSWRTGNELVRQAGKTADLTIEFEAEPRAGQSQNVIAMLQGENEYWLSVSAHHDTAPFDPGALDNNTGSAMLLALAEAFAGKKLPATVYFVSTGSEENGGFDMCGAGAKAFYKQMHGRLDKCIAHIEIDSIGNNIAIPRICYRGNQRFRKVIGGLGIELSEKLEFSCDHGAAAKSGVPFAWFNDTPDIRPWYHSPADTAENMNIDNCAAFFEPVESLIDTLAKETPFASYLREDERLIRPARFEDFPSIEEINRQAFGPVSMNRMQEDFFGEELGNVPWHVHKNQGAIAFIEKFLHQAIVCEISGQVVGYATAIYNYERGIAEIGNNAVLPEFQGQGIGKAMQREIARRMDEDGFKRLEVCTLEQDIPAQRIYEKLGYRKYTANIHYLKRS
jgi:aminopeptidase YwaD